MPFGLQIETTSKAVELSAVGLAVWPALFLVLLLLVVLISPDRGAAMERAR